MQSKAKAEIKSDAPSATEQSSGMCYPRKKTVFIMLDQLTLFFSYQCELV
jgi:predicted AlkP superfamily pyrophosphatase or phosphodiesterase